jgi:hypothetical protein
MKGIAGELGEMKIPLRSKERPIRQQPYRLNPIYKNKVKAEIKRMLETRIIEPVEELEWIKRRDKDMHRLEEVERCMPT